jgi:hypothetical protein
MRPPREPDEGTAVVEFALVLPLLLVVGLALVQTGLLVRDRLLVESGGGARGSARRRRPGGPPRDPLRGPRRRALAR